MSSWAKDPVLRHRLTVNDYYRMGETGILRPDARVELIEGEIIDMAPIGSRHSGTVTQLAGILQRAAGDLAVVQIQNPIHLDDYSEPEPDLALLRPRQDFYKTSHPRPNDVLLIIEVADTSLRYDRDVKAPLYARNGVPEVWLIDVESRRFTRYRDPLDGAYARVDSPELDAPLVVASAPDLSLDLATIFVD